MFFADVVDHEMYDVANFETLQYLTLLNKGGYLVETILV